MTLREMLDKRAKHWDAMKAFLDSHRTDNGTLSAEDDATYTKMERRRRIRQNGGGARGIQQGGKAP